MCTSFRQVFRLSDPSSVFSLFLFGATFGYIINEYSHRFKNFRLSVFGSGNDITPDGGSFFDQTLSSHSGYIEGQKARSDVSWLLDFAVIGNAHSGTTLLDNYLRNNSVDEIYMLPNEICEMTGNRTDHLVQIFYDHRKDVSVKGKFLYTADGRKIKTGLTCPKDIGSSDGLKRYAMHFPMTKLIVTMRHPVLWFQSFYNFASYNEYPSTLPTPREFIERCLADSSYGCKNGCGIEKTEHNCMDGIKIHHRLSRLGKTPMLPPESKLLDHDMEVIPIKSSIFLLEQEQLFPERNISQSIAEDLSTFLALGRQLPKLEIIGGHTNSFPDAKRRTKFMNICDADNTDVREILVAIGEESSTWIRDYFLDSPDVTVSSMEVFIDIIAKWGQDPCVDER